MVREKRAEFLYRSAGKALFVERLRLIVRERQNEIARQLSNSSNLRIRKFALRDTRFDCVTVFSEYTACVLRPGKNVPFRHTSVEPVFLQLA